jgi:tRNA pseudouridine38-40 synthase
LSLEDQISFRAAERDVATFRMLLAQFKGLHKFHNYSSGFNPAMPDCKRYIIDASCDLVIIDMQEFIRVRFHGQSFILNQIRKMVSIADLLIKGCLPDCISTL